MSASHKKVRVAIIGLGFGAEFIPIYQAHPNANLVAVCQRGPKKLASLQKAFGIPKGYTDYADLLRDPEIDAVHINTPIPDHAAQSIAALKAGNVRLVLSRSICSGKYMVLVAGDPSAVQSAIAAASEAAHGCLIDSFVITNIHPDVITAMGRTCHDTHRESKAKNSPRP